MRVRVRNITGNGQKIREKCNIFINFFRNYYRILPTRPQMSKDYFFKSEKDLKNLKQGTNLSTHFKVTGSNDDVMRRFHDSLRRFGYSPQAKSYVLNFR